MPPAPLSSHSITSSYIMPHGIGGNRCTPSTPQRSGASRYKWRVLRGSMYRSYCVDHNEHDSACSYDLRGEILRVSNCICLGILHALHYMGWAFQSAPPPPQSTTWHHDVVQDGDVEANPGPHPTQQILSGSRGLGHPSGRITTTYPPEPQAGVTGPALREPPHPARPWNDLTTIGDISQFLRTTASINTKVSSLVALHHHLLQHCHVDHNTLPGEMHGAVLCTPPRDSKTAPSAPASPTTDTTEVHSPGSPMTPTGGLDIQCSRCGVRDFYSLCCSTCGDHLWGLDVHEGMAPTPVPGLDVETDPQAVASSSTLASGTTSFMTGCAQREAPPRDSPQPERPQAANSPHLHVACHMDQRPTANHGPQVPVHQCGDVQRQQDPSAYLIPSQTGTDDPNWGWLPAGLLHRHVGRPPPTDAQGDSSWGWLPTDLLYRPEELPTSAEAHASPRSSLLQLGEAHGEHGEVSSLDGSGGGQYSIEVLRQDLERCPLCYEDALLFLLPCHPLHRLCTGCADAHMTPGFRDAHGDAHPMDSQGTSKNQPRPRRDPARRRRLHGPRHTISRSGLQSNALVWGGFFGLPFLPQRTPHANYIARCGGFRMDTPPAPF